MGFEGLTIEDREVIILCDAEGFSGQEVATILDLSVAGSRADSIERGCASSPTSAGESGMASERIVAGIRCTEVLADLSDYADGQ